jgi:hypothetical protein
MNSTQSYQIEKPTDSKAGRQSHASDKSAVETTGEGRQTPRCDCLHPCRLWPWCDVSKHLHSGAFVDGMGGREVRLADQIRRQMLTGQNSQDPILYPLGKFIRPLVHGLVRNPYGFGGRSNGAAQ